MIQLEMLREATNGDWLTSHRSGQAESFAHDSRAVSASQCFVAIRGAHGDGHDHLEDAVANGATSLLVQRNRLDVLLAGDTAWATRMDERGVAIIAVDDTRAALRAYAARVLATWQPYVIAVAGSAGKTTTKEAIAEVLSLAAPTFRSWRNYNDLLGVPLSLGALTPEHRFAVIELAADHPGEMAKLCDLVHPRLGVLTCAAETHLRYFGTAEAMLEELAALPAALPAGGVFLAQLADPATRALAGRTQARVSWLDGDTSEPHRWRIVPMAVNGPQCLTLSRADGATISFPGLIGDHWATAIFAALAIARERHIGEAETLERLRTLRPLPGRMRLLPGDGGMTLLDDTHNAIPASVSAGLVALRALTGGPHIAVLGDMLRMGDRTGEAHREMGEQVARCADTLVARGAHAEEVARSAIAHGLPEERTVIAHTAADAARAVRTFAAALAPTQPPVVYLKGSEELRMEQVTALLLADPAQASDALDRQTEAWRHVRFMQPDRPTWLEIDLNAIANNTSAIAGLVGPHVRVLVSLKADGYGHGALRVARTALHNGAAWLGVATVSEAQTLRHAGISAPILVFGYIPPWQAREAVLLDVRATVYNVEIAQALAAAGRDLGKPLRAHVKVDTGMARLGIRAEDPAAVVRLIEQLHTLEGLDLEGLFTHFATADAADLTYARRQLDRFHTVLSALDARALRPPIVHAANSAAIITLPESRFDMVRPGILIYGLAPSAEVAMPPEIRPALAFKTRVAQVKRVPEGEGVSYGATWTTPRETTLAVLPVGYADGFRRAPSNWGEVLVRGQFAPIVGRVAMDQCMIDVTDVPGVREGDEVVLIGEQGEESLTAEMVAARLGTINYEVVSALLPRVPRVDPTGM